MSGSTKGQEPTVDADAGAEEQQQSGRSDETGERLVAQEGEPLKRHGDALRHGSGDRHGAVGPDERPRT